MAKVITYRRVSTEEQAAHGQSLEAQKRVLLKWAADNNHTVAAEFADEGISAWDTSKVRPGLLEALLYCKDHQVAMLLVYSFDRFSRDLTQSLLLRSEFKKHNCGVVSITEPADPETPSGKLMISVLGSFAQFFSDQSSAKVLMSLKRKARTGKSCGGPVPFGYRIGDDKYVLGPEEEVKAVQCMFNLYVNKGLSILCRKLCAIICHTEG